ncbi:unnamed protein product [Hymenolepis diminuta]|uniref:Uncharacterized protein n=1 Tax=Hymenolepis diminuta TaxID=6216 RepID=A0A564YVK6_HYMDI|nr:unnamed protein product [Hymenolepis diminuta]
MQNVQALPTCFVSNLIFIPTDLKSCSFTFLPDAVCKPLQAIYDGPFPIPQRGEKTFTILQNGKESIVSMGSVKPAYLDKLVIENATSVFPSDTPVEETEEPIPILVLVDIYLSQIFTRLENSNPLCFLSNSYVSHPLLITYSS